MQNWDRNRQDAKFKQKLTNVRSTLPKINYANNSGPSIISKKPSSQSNNQNLNNLENLYINVTYKMKQSPNSSGGQASSGSTTSPQSQGSIPSLNKGKNKEMKKQNYLKHLLNEFGLSQYLRKLYELGYDDNNINKIGLMNRKSFQELLNNMKMYPGQSIKMEKLYNYLKQLNLANTMYNTRLLGARTAQMRQKKPATSDSNKRRINTALAYNNILNNNSNINHMNNNNKIMNYGNNNENNYNINNQNERPKTSTNFKIQQIQKIPNNHPINNNNKTKSKTIDNNFNMHGFLSPNNLSKNQNQNQSDYNLKNNILLNSFKKGDLGYGFYMNNNNNKNIDEAKNQKGNNTNDALQKDFPNNYSSQNSKEFNKFENINSFPSIMNNNNNYNDNEGELIEEKMTEDIDNMLKFYMEQLNEKLDDSYGSIEDSSLSHNLSLPFTESISNNNKINNNFINKNQKLNNINNNVNNNTNASNKTHQNSGKLKLPNIKDKQNINKEQKTEKSDKEIKNNEKQNLKNQKKIEKTSNPEIINKNQEKENPKVSEIKKDQEVKEIKSNNNSNILPNESKISKISENINQKGEVKNDSFIEDIILEDEIINEENKNKEIKNNENINQNKDKENKEKENKEKEENNNKIIVELNCIGQINDLKWMTNIILLSPEKNNLYIGSQDKTIKIYKILNYNEYQNNNKLEFIFKNIGSLKGHNREITLIKAIGDKIISVGNDFALKIWNNE